mmetsp:Transcript_799/g.1006  ORF Transcript_799/g.1006 Transcript_799/m.1006 type:complete len:87 (+) Transcript_799:566-826(+)
MGDEDSIDVRDQTDFSLKQQFSIPTSHVGDNTGIVILYLTASQDQSKIGLVLGRRLIKEEEEITDLIIYKWNSVANSGRGEYEQEK